MAISTIRARRGATSSFGARGTLYIQGWQAASADFANEAAQVQQRVRSITDAAAEKIETAQRAGGSFNDITGDTRGSVENTQEDRPDGYARAIGPTHFVARFLVFGTVRRPGSMWDIYGISRPHMNAWLDDMSNVSTL